MAQRKSYLLRLPAGLMDELSRWAKDELRSLNAQIEYALREALRRQRRGGAVEPDSTAGAAGDATESSDAPPPNSA